jgi:hypothetical protein
VFDVLGSQIGGLLKSLLGWAIPLSFLAKHTINRSSLFVSLHHFPFGFLALLNTIITPSQCHVF